MADHPSLGADFVPPEPLRPVMSMDPYKPCWCRSGKKFKFCHYQRDKQAQINIFEVEEKTRREFQQGYCSYPKAANDPCGPQIVNAHTVQRRGGLTAIAEDSHVLTVKPTMKSLFENQGEASVRRLGLKQASVFPGFCDKHDTQLFKPVEGASVVLGKETAFLLAYRAIAYERFNKEVQLRATATQREMDRGHPFGKQVVLQHYIFAVEEGVKRGLRDITQWKERYDDRLIRGDYNDFHYYAIRFDRVLPIVGCGAFHVEHDFNGRTLQTLGREVGVLEHVSLNITSFGSQTVAILAFLGDVDGPAAAFLQSFVAVPEDRKADALVRVGFEQMENIYLKPSWWDALGSPDKATLLERVGSGTPRRARRPDCLVDQGTTYASGAVIEEGAG